MLTPFFLHKKRWSSEQLLQMCVNHQHNLRHHCRPMFWECTWTHPDKQIDRRSKFENFHKIARQIHRHSRENRHTENLHSYKCRRHFSCTRRGGQQRNCYTGRQSYVNDHDNEYNRCTCRIWECTQNHRDKRILRRSMIVREFLQEEQTGCKER